MYIIQERYTKKAWAETFFRPGTERSNFWIDTKRKYKNITDAKLFLKGLTGMLNKHPAGVEHRIINKRSFRWLKSYLQNWFYEKKVWKK